jgi:hypothetical protein
MIAIRIFRNPLMEKELATLGARLERVYSHVEEMSSKADRIDTIRSATRNDDFSLLERKLSALQTRVDAISLNVARLRAEVAKAGLDAESQCQAKMVSPTAPSPVFVTQDLMAASMDNLIGLINGLHADLLAQAARQDAEMQTVLQLNAQFLRIEKP